MEKVLYIKPIRLTSELCVTHRIHDFLVPYYTSNTRDPSNGTYRYFPCHYSKVPMELDLEQKITIRCNQEE